MLDRIAGYGHRHLLRPGIDERGKRVRSGQGAALTGAPCMPRDLVRQPAHEFKRQIVAPAGDRG